MDFHHNGDGNKVTRGRQTHSDLVVFAHTLTVARGRDIVTLVTAGSLFGIAVGDEQRGSRDRKPSTLGLLTETTPVCHSPARKNRVGLRTATVPYRKTEQAIRLATSEINRLPSRSKTCSFNNHAQSKDRQGLETAGADTVSRRTGRG